MSARERVEADADAPVLWRRLDRPGHEAARLMRRDTRWHLAGTAVFAHDGRPCRLDYLVVCDAAWRTMSAVVTGWVGPDTIDTEITVDRGRWRLNGVERPEVTGCIDVDLNFSPSTNLIPIRRLALAVGQDAEVRAAWLRFPEFTLEPLDQRYRRLQETAYRYESNRGQFVADLEVNRAGIVTHYPGLCRAEP